MWKVKLNAAQVSLMLALGVLFAVFNGPHLMQPPVWDTATGLFPAAIYLANHSFDIMGLLREPGWFDGGPNTYATSPLTWFTALAYIIIGKPTHVFVFLHLVQGSLVCLWGLSIHRLAEKDFGSVAPALAFVVFTIPVVLAQTGYMYSEIALGLCTTAAFVRLADGRTRQAAALAFLATTLKHAGIVVAAVGVAYLVVRRPKHWVRDSFLIGLPSLVAFVLITLSIRSEAGTHVMSNPTPYLRALEAVKFRMLLVPDLLALTCVSLLIALVVISLSLFKKIDSPTLLLSSLFVCAFVGFFLLVPLIATSWMLVRYFVQATPYLLILPFAAIFWGLRLLPEKAKVGVQWGLVLAVSAAFLSNREGRFYPPFKGTGFSIVERDLNYRKLLEFQQEFVTSAVQMPAETPKYVSREMHYFLTIPELGYVSQVIPNTRFILTDKPRSLGQFPSDFYLIISNQNHGGEILNRVMKQAKNSKRHSATTTLISKHGIHGAVVEVHRSPFIGR